MFSTKKAPKSTNVLANNISLSARWHRAQASRSNNPRGFAFPYNKTDPVEQISKKNAAVRPQEKPYAKPHFSKFNRFCEMMQFNLVTSHDDGNSMSRKPQSFLHPRKNPRRAQSSIQSRIKLTTFDSYQTHDGAILKHQHHINLLRLYGKLFGKLNYLPKFVLSFGQFVRMH